MVVSATLISVLAGISGLTGALMVIAYLYVFSKIKALDLSNNKPLRETIEGAHLFNSAQVINILKTFSTDDARLKALRELAKVEAKSQDSATQLYKKISPIINIADMQTQQFSQIRRISGQIAPVLIIFAFMLLTYGIVRIPWFLDIVFNQINASIGRTEVIKYASKPIIAISRAGSTAGTYSTTSCIEAPPGATFDLETVSIDADATGSSGTGPLAQNVAREHSQTTILVKTPTKICWQITVSSPANEWEVSGHASLSVSLIEPIGNRLPVTQSGP